MRSKDPKTQVGCVIVDSKTLKILSIGYNGFPPGISNSVKNWSDEEKNDLVAHAEQNAVLLKGGASLENAIAFVTLFPCEDCAKMLIQVNAFCHTLHFNTYNIIFNTYNMLFLETIITKARYS